MTKETINYTNALKAVIQHLEEARTHHRALETLKSLPEYLHAENARIESAKQDARKQALQDAYEICEKVEIEWDTTGGKRAAAKCVNEIFKIKHDTHPPKQANQEFTGLKKVSTESLPPEFQKILHDNLWDLYEADSKTTI